ncbi:MAG: LysR family transcriptional regulator [Herpetosiphonaceae bacterium]|nr:LysR family transcriptional regulator [Herpetosiphonaceae bacterium]
MQLDLNLLVVLDALLEEGSVGGAAARLYLSEPAMSRALGRIRRATGDQILVRTGRTMTPTQRALAMRADVHALVQQAYAVLAPDRELALDTLERTFTLRCHDALLMACGPHLLAAIQTHAPSVSLRLLPEASSDTNDLRHGQIDLEVGSAEPSLPEIHFETIGHVQFVVALRPDHPLMEGELTIDRYAAACHIIVSRRGRLHDPIDEALASRGLQRRVVASAPTSAAALHFVRQSDLVAAVPLHLCGPHTNAPDLCTLPLPFDVPPIAINQAWHHRYDNDKAHTWLRNQVRDGLRPLCN